MTTRYSKKNISRNSLGKNNLLKGQEISEGNCGVLNFPKNQRKSSLISAQASKKWSNQKNKGTLLY